VDAFFKIMGVLIIIVCAIVLAISGFCAIIFFDHGEVSGPLILTASVCAAIIFGITWGLRKAP
jgi:hypothetical protein